MRYRGGRLEDFVGDVIKYVVAKASCRVIVTAPPAGLLAEPESAEAQPAGAAAS